MSERPAIIRPILIICLAAALLVCGCGGDNDAAKKSVDPAPAGSADQTESREQSAAAENTQETREEDFEQQLARYISRTYYFGDDKPRYLRNGEVYRGPGEIDEIVDAATGEIACYAVSDRPKMRLVEEPSPGRTYETERERYALFSTEGEQLTDYENCRYQLAVGGMVLKSTGPDSHGQMKSGLYDVLTGECLIEGVYHVVRIGDSLVVLGGYLNGVHDYLIRGLLDTDNRELIPFEPDIGTAVRGKLVYQYSYHCSDYMRICDVDDGGDVLTRYLLDSDLKLLASFDAQDRMALPGDDTSAVGDILTVRRTAKNGRSTCKFYSLPDMRLIKAYDRDETGIPGYFDGERAIMWDEGMYLQDPDGRSLAGPMKYIYSCEAPNSMSLYAPAEYFYGFDAVNDTVYTLSRDGEILSELHDPKVSNIAPCGEYLQAEISDGGKWKKILLDKDLNEVFSDSEYSVHPFTRDGSGQKIIDGIFIGTYKNESRYVFLDADGTVLADDILDYHVEDDVILVTTGQRYGLMDLTGHWITE